MAINLEIADLEAVLAVAHSGSFRAAAESLHLSQPSVSARIRHAEDVLGVKLFHRTTRRVSITEHGERLCARAEHTIAELRAVLKEFKDETQLKRGRVVLGATPSIAGSIVPEVIRRFAQRWPGIEVILRDDVLGRSLDRLSSGEIDFAITPLQKADPRFDFELLYSDELLLFAPAGHPLLKNSTVSLAAVSKYPFLSTPVQGTMWGMVADAFAAIGMEFKPAFQSIHILSLIAMVKAGVGVTLLPRLILPLLNMESFGVASVGRNGLHRRVGLTTAHGRAIKPVAKSLMDAFRDAANKSGIRR